MSRYAEQGSSIVMVLGILLVISLLGAGLLLQSNLDTQFTRAAVLYDHSFQVADGGVDIGVANLYRDDPDRQMRLYRGNPLHSKVLEEDFGRLDGKGKPVNTMNPPLGGDGNRDPARGAIGMFACTNIMKGNDSAREAGWDAGKFYQQYWLSEGRGESGRARYGGAMLQVVTTGNVERTISSNFVDAAVSRKGWSHYGDY